MTIIGYIPSNSTRDTQYISQEEYMKLFEEGEYRIIRDIIFEPTKKVVCDGNLIEKIIIREDYHMLDRILRYTRHDGYVQALYLLAQYCKKEKHKEYMGMFYDLQDDYFDNAMEAINYDTIITDYINTHSN